MYCTVALSTCDQPLTLSAAARSLFVKSAPPFQRVHSLIGVTGNLCLELCCRAGSSPGSRSPCCDAHRLRDSTMTPCRRQHPDRHSPPSTHSGNGTQCASTVFCVCVSGGNLALHLHWHVNGLLHLLNHWCLLHPALDQELHLRKLNTPLPQSTLNS